jgi:hypothetical protein
MFSRLETGKIIARAEGYPLLIVIVPGGFNPEVVIAGAEIDFIVGARLLILVGDQVLGAKIGIGGSFLGASAASTSEPAREQTHYRRRRNAPDFHCRDRRSGSSTWGKCAWCPIRVSPWKIVSNLFQKFGGRSIADGPDLMRRAPCHRRVPLSKRAA